MVTVLEALTQPCAAFTSFAPEGRNTVIQTQIAPDTWYLWDDFNYDNITTIFKHQLKTQYHGETEPKAQSTQMARPVNKSIGEGQVNWRWPGQALFQQPTSGPSPASTM